MAIPTRASSKLHPAIAGGIIALFAALFIWLLSFSPWKIIPFALAGQAYALIIILLAFRYWPPMIRLVKSMPVPHRVVFGVLVGAMILGHYTLNNRTYFPYVAWEIFPFVNECDPVTCREFIATTESGAKVRLLVEQLFPSIVQIDPLDALDDPKLYPPGTTEHLARALAKAYNEHHAGDPVRRVDLFIMAVKLHPPASESRNRPSCELLKRYDISSGQ
jgi:hypothetical protein